MSIRSLKNKVVVITGAGSGIGRALAQKLASRHARLVLTDVNEAGLAETMASLEQHRTECISRWCDVASHEAVHALAQEVFERFGGADVIINNAGVSVVSPVLSLTFEDAHWLMNINFWGVVHGCRAFMPQLLNRPEALIVNISSIFAMVSMPTQSIYNASKAAVRGFSDALREELRGTSVSVLCVHPGGIKTSIAKNARLGDISMLAESAAALHAHFEKNARTTPEQAAEKILAAIESGRTRLLIGADARLLDAVFRIVPTQASRFMVWLSKQQGARN
jgi:short-subunit dehydrogenase